MKNISLFMIALFLGVGAMAQVNTDSTKSSMNNNWNRDSMRTSSMNDDSKMVREFYIMRDGKLIKVKNKVKTDQVDNVTLDNGTQISSNGQVQFKDGKTETLKEGEMIDENGNIHSRNRMNNGKMDENHNMKNGRNMRDPDMPRNRMNRSDSSWKNHRNRNNSWNRTDSSMNTNGTMNNNSKDTIR